MHGIGCPHEGNAEAPALEAGLGRQPILIRLLRPILSRGVLVVIGPTATTVEHRADLVFADLLGRHLTEVRLDHLADLLFQRHLRQQSLDLLLHIFILGDGAADLRPLRKMRDIRHSLHRHSARRHSTRNATTHQ